MAKLKIIFRFLLYLSIGFVIYYLYKFDYLVFKQIEFNYLLLAISIILLWLGFYTSTLSWRASLQAHGIKIDKSLAIYSHGISVFSKYIPGKIWVILGRASIVSEKGDSLSLLTTISLKEQLVYLFLGLCISLFILPTLPINIIITLIVLLSAISLGIFLFIKPIHDFTLQLIFKLFNKSIDIPFINIREIWSFAWIILLYWAMWSFGFFLLVQSIAPDSSILTAFIFPVSVCYGLIAVIVPGGIGVRESIIVLLLTAMGIDSAQAVTISIIQRFWFITGEVFIFILAFTNRK